MINFSYINLFEILFQHLFSTFRSSNCLWNLFFDFILKIHLFVGLFKFLFDKIALVMNLVRNNFCIKIFLELINDLSSCGMCFEFWQRLGKFLRNLSCLGGIVFKSNKRLRFNRSSPLRLNRRFERFKLSCFNLLHKNFLIVV